MMEEDYCICNCHNAISSRGRVPSTENILPAKYGTLGPCESGACLFVPPAIG